MAVSYRNRLVHGNSVEGAVAYGRAGPRRI